MTTTKLNLENVSRKGLTNIIVAICHDAAIDFVYGNEEQSADAEKFFRSKWFSRLTSLDGNVIVNRLNEIKRREAM